jgi:release factor glutamine methyltransferase
LIEELRKSGARKLRILDMCTGSGCIALALGKAFPDAEIYAVDISSFALFLVKENRRRLGLHNIIDIESNLFTHVPQELSFDLIVTNPPYISDKEFARLDLSVKNWEDARALLAEDDGLALISDIIALAPTYLRPNLLLQEQGISQLYIEIGWQQGAAVEELMHKAGYADVVVVRDTARKDRMVKGSFAHVALAADKK